MVDYTRRNVTYGKVFTCKKGKWKGKRVRYSYLNKKKSSKKLTLYKPRRSR